MFRQSSSSRPLVTLALLAYNQQRFVAEAIAAAFAQDYEPLEIILSDDCSSDRTFEIMQHMAQTYRGPHRIRLNRNELNLGLASHYNWITENSSGEIIVGAAGDDVSLSSRVTDSVAVFVQYPDVTMVSFTDCRIDDEGNVVFVPPSSRTLSHVDLAAFLCSGPLAQSRLKLSGASRAILRQTYTLFGDLDPNCPAEDSPYVMRSLILGRAAVCDWPGIRYRHHEEQLSAEKSIAQMETSQFNAQYVSDLDLAAREGFLDAAMIASVRRWIAERDLYTAVRKLKLRGEVPTLATAMRTVRSRSFSALEKIGMVRRALLRQPL